MIPDLREHGYLPPGVHPAIFQEIIDRFGGSARRTDLLRNLEQLIRVARRVRAVRIVVDGSFVTREANPEDVDAILVVSDDFDSRTSDAQILANAKWLFNVHLFIERESSHRRISLWLDFFGHDRQGTPKGLLEVQL